MTTINLADGTTIKNLGEEQKAPLRTWWLNMVRGEASGPLSLWVYGDRGAGSSYVGRVAFHKVLREHIDWKWEYFSAETVMNGMREMWRLEQHPGVYESDELSQDYWRLESDFDRLWNKADVVWIDDLYDTIDTSFWRRHVHNKLEQRVKAGRITIVSTNMAPNHRVFQDITRVIEQRFVIVRADHAGG